MAPPEENQRVSDVTEAVSAAAEKDRQGMDVLLSVSQMVAGNLSLDEVLQSAMGAASAALDAEAVPALIDIGQTNWSQVAAVLERYTKLPLVIMATSYRINRHIYPLFEKYDNLYLESHTYQIPWGIEDVSKRFGADRLIFGTSLPEMEGGAAIGQVLYADLSDEDKAKIAGGNLRRLLSI